MKNSGKPAKNFTWQVLIVPAIFLFALMAMGRIYHRNSRHVHADDAGMLTVDSSTLQTKVYQQPDGNYLPAIHKNDEIVKHFAYTLDYSETDEEPRWVAYQLTAVMASAKGKRQGDFRPDPAVRTGSAIPQDYKGSGYDRGHLCPAADMKWSYKAQSECFLMSNMSPQVHAFNAGIWEELEKDVRKWAKVNGSVYVVTGPLLNKGLPKIGPDGVSIPQYFYKIVFDATNPDIKMIGFILPNRQVNDELWNYAVPVKEIEKKTGIDFFPSLPDSLETALESQSDIVKWRQTAVQHRKKQTHY